MIAVCFSVLTVLGGMPAKKTPVVTTLIIVRHAEKNNETDTTTLTPAGYDRANRLAQLLVNTELAAIYTTPYIRMRLTAEPTAKQKNLPILDYTPHEISETDRIISTHTGKTVLVVGHGNSIPAIMNQYCGTQLENLGGYNDVFIVSILNAKASSNRYLHFFY